MDISCIISSGDLELYVLGMLSQEDNLKVAQLAEMFPEIKQEIDDIQQSLLQISDDADATDLPSASVKDNLFAKLKTLETTENTAVSPDNNIDTVAEEKQEAKVIQMRQPKRNNGLLAASVIALLACAALIGYLVSNNNKLQNTTNNLQAQVTDLRKNADTQQQQLSTFANALQLYQNPSYQKINLTPVPGKPEALVQLFWNKATHDVYVADISLPQAPAGKQYQLWALIDGKPVNAGMLTGNKLPQQMIDFSKADAFAITLEKAGGSLTPTLTEMYVMGKTSG